MAQAELHSPSTQASPRSAEARLAALIKVIWEAPDFYTMPTLRGMICEAKL